MAKQTVKVTSAIKLDAKSLTTLAAFIKSKHQLEPDIFVTVDPGLIAGFKFIVEGVEYDYSLDGSLTRLEQEL
jgi:F0F1-type ATP synthase delta subunit